MKDRTYRQYLYERSKTITIIKTMEDEKKIDPQNAKTDHDGNRSDDQKKNDQKTQDNAPLDKPVTR
jgi:mannose-6-phosphate isomerase class I